MAKKPFHKFLFAFINYSAASTGTTGRHLIAHVKRSQELTKTRIEKELNSELKGISLSVLGTII